MKFLTEINSFHPTIRFTIKWCQKSVMFLDTRVIPDWNCLVTDFYTKPTDTHEYLDHQTHHPSLCKASIAHSQTLRLQRICSKFTYYICHVEELMGHLAKRGYNGEKVQQNTDKALERHEKNY